MARQALRGWVHPPGAMADAEIVRLQQEEGFAYLK